ncbi:MAG: hypothetical protein Q8N23_12980 [Archangium sp.]|nr:hypothetical protein [Archangium sp.]MDP3153584.1 hypothetical protein [Archangium sp.]MDP3569348.1 hypothetical protein [Archangium sp.]
MIAPALALVLASNLSVKVVSVDFAYPYFGEPGNTCQRGSVYIRAVADTQDGRSPTPVVVRLEDSAGLTPGSEAVLDVRRAGTGRDGTVVYCSAGRQAAAPAPVPPPFPAAEPLQPVESSQPAPAVDTSTKPAGSGCTARLFNIIKKPLGEKKFGPSEFEEAELGAPEAVDCSLARSRVTNVLLLRMVKDGFSKPHEVVGAEWAPNSSWQRDPDAPQRRAVKVYLEAL